jgi:hypothetical protein
VLVFFILHLYKRTQDKMFSFENEKLQSMPSGQVSQDMNVNNVPMSKSSVMQQAFIPSGKDIGFGIGANITDALLTAVNTGLIYKFVLESDNMPESLNIPWINWEIPTWLLYSLTSGVTALISGAVTRTILPSTIKLSNLQYAGFQLGEPVANMAVGTLMSWLLLFKIPPDKATNVPAMIIANMGDMRTWMGHLKTGFVFGVSTLFAELESDLIWGSASMIKI